MNNIHIAILDTYVDLKNNLFKNKVKYAIPGKESQIINSNHATSMCGEIIANCSNVKIDVYPIFENNFSTGAANILQTLSLISDQKDNNYDIIMLSLGFDGSDYAIELSDICKKLYAKGIVIVSAFNNHGGLSYPACLDSVIGIDTSPMILDPNSFYIIKKSPINVVCSSRPRAVIQPGGKKALMAGTSICTAYITGIVAQIMLRGKKKPKEILAALEEMAAQEFEDINYAPLSNPYKKGMKYAIFPYSKEIETIATLCEYSDLQLIDIYDFNKSINIGKTISSSQNTFQVKGSGSISWDNFDLLVIGHFDKYISLSARIEKEIDNIILQAISKRKYIYCFDNLLYKKLEKYDKKFIPNITSNDIPRYRNSRLWECPIPIISVIGTGPKQGKFSTQIKLMQKFISDGYKVGSISTEPYGYLFDMDYIFPYGYNANIEVPFKDYASILNEWVYNLYKQENDVILTALQSGILPRNYSRKEEDLCRQFSVLFGLNPDVAVLCVYPNDDIFFIKRSIIYINAVFQINIIPILVYPYKYWISDSGKECKENISSTSEYQTQLGVLEKQFPNSVFEMNEKGYEGIYQYILNGLQ